MIYYVGSWSNKFVKHCLFYKGKSLRLPYSFKLAVALSLQQTYSHYHFQFQRQYPVFGSNIIFVYKLDMKTGRPCCIQGLGHWASLKSDTVSVQECHTPCVAWLVSFWCDKSVLQEQTDIPDVAVVAPHL